MRQCISILGVLICAALSAQIVSPSRGGGNGMRGGGGRTNVHQGPDSLHRPWAGSDTYQKNIESGRGGGRSGRSDFQRDRDSTLDVYHREEDRARRIQREERQSAEKESQVRANKAQIEADRRQAEIDRKARADAQQAELRRRAEDQERRQEMRNLLSEAHYDAAVRALKPCQALLGEGHPCPRKANPGYSYCYLHLDWKGPVVSAGSPKTEEETLPQDDTPIQVQQAAAHPPADRPAVSQPTKPADAAVSRDVVPSASGPAPAPATDHDAALRQTLVVGGFCLLGIVLVGWFVLRAIRLAKKSPFEP